MTGCSTSKPAKLWVKARPSVQHNKVLPFGPMESRCSKKGALPGALAARLQQVQVTETRVSSQWIIGLVNGVYDAFAVQVDTFQLYRQESVLRRIALELSRATLARWMIRVGVQIQPLINPLCDQILENDIVQMDETRIQVLTEPDKRVQLIGPTPGCWPSLYR